MNLLLSLCITLISLIVVIGFGFSNVEWIKLNLSGFAYTGLFLNAFFLFISSFRFQPQDSRSRLLSYGAALLYIATPFFPILLFIILGTMHINLEGSLALIVLGLPVFIATILAWVVAVRVSTNRFSQVE